MHNVHPSVIVRFLHIFMTCVVVGLFFLDFAQIFTSPLAIGVRVMQTSKKAARQKSDHYEYAWENAFPILIERRKMTIPHIIKAIICLVVFLPRFFLLHFRWLLSAVKSVDAHHLTKMIHLLRSLSKTKAIIKCVHCQVCRVYQAYCLSSS